ncbi:hypothetical protein MTBBW1_1850006 [Desulfamplus magnetovallimortis]|uniref:Uncharacterized protein n=1 Tax=Desulfamplus magnetovallimortis TaxID=1246637 RepID=A0A1W1HAH7_9BACT|nr:hypothetical protein MTBBW1_1850006 [Desulfamplus magnetovallimortis]
MSLQTPEKIDLFIEKDYGQRPWENYLSLILNSSSVISSLNGDHR